jgi:hypothetical protein
MILVASRTLPSAEMSTSEAEAGADNCYDMQVEAHHSDQERTRVALMVGVSLAVMVSLCF